MPDDVAFIRLRTDGCAFIVSEPNSAAAGSCGAPRQADSAYCPGHHARCHLPAGSLAELRQLREIEAMAEAVGGRLGREARSPPEPLLRRLIRLERRFS
jgi:hypothetical protein